MKPVLAAVGSATVAVLSQSSGIAAIFPHEAGSLLPVLMFGFNRVIITRAGNV